MINYDIVMIGHITKDTIIISGKEKLAVGGAVYYSSIATARSGKRVLVVTRAAREDENLFSEMVDNGIDFVNLGAPVTTSMECRYNTADMERRKITCTAVAPSYTIEQIPDVNAPIYHLAGLVRGEIPSSLIYQLASRGRIALDVQSILRCNENGELIFRDWEDQNKYLSYISYLKTDAAEAEIMTGETNREIAAKMLYSWGAKEVLITHNTGVLVFNGKEFLKKPFNSSNLSGRTGRGDTCFAAYLAWRLSHEIEESIDYAASLTSIKMEIPGAFKGSIQDVLSRSNSNVVFQNNL